MKDLELCTYIATRESVGATARYVNLPLRNKTPVTSGSNRSKLIVTAFDVPSILLARYCSRGLYFDTAPTLRADQQPCQNGQQPAEFIQGFGRFKIPDRDPQVESNPAESPHGAKGLSVREAAVVE
jgi:hypothetical protein